MGTAFGAGHGEPTFNFHPPLPQYLTVFFHEAGFTFIAAENLAALVLLVLAGVGCTSSPAKLSAPEED